MQNWLSDCADLRVSALSIEQELATLFRFVVRENQTWRFLQPVSFAVGGAVELPVDVHSSEISLRFKGAFKSSGSQTISSRDGEIRRLQQDYNRDNGVLHVSFDFVLDARPNKVDIVFGSAETTCTLRFLVTDAHEAREEGLEVSLLPPIRFEKSLPIMPIIATKLESIEVPQFTADSPLFRAQLDAMEARALSLRKSLKQANKAIHTALGALQEATAAITELDHALSAFNLPELFAGLLQEHCQPSLALLNSTLSAIRAAVESNLSEVFQNHAKDLRTLEHNRKAFDLASKHFLDEEAKYLAITYPHSTDHYELAKLRFADASKLFLEQLSRDADQRSMIVAKAVWSLCQSVQTTRDSEAYPVANLSESLDKVSARIHSAMPPEILIEPPEERPVTPSDAGKLSRQRRFSWSPKLGPISGNSHKRSQSYAPMPLEKSPPTINVTSIEQAQRRKEGYLYTAASSQLHLNDSASKPAFRRVWTVVASGVLQDYQADRMQPNDAAIQLKYACVKSSTASDRQFVFEVITTSARKILQATSAKDAEDWMRAIQLQIEAVLNGSSSIAIRSRSFSEDDVPAQGTVGAKRLFSELAKSRNGAHKRLDVRQAGRAIKNARSRYNNELPSLPEASKSVSSFFDHELPSPTIDAAPYSPALSSTGDDIAIAQAVRALAASFSSDTISDLRSPQAILEVFLLLPANQTCFECGVGQPRWASLNLGVFICPTCAGVHRSLGTSISRVRSVDLDDWNADQVAQMKRLGNLVAKQTWPPIENATTLTDGIQRRYLLPAIKPAEMAHYPIANGLRFGLPRLQQGVLEVYEARSNMEDVLHDTLDQHSAGKIRLSKKDVKKLQDSYEEAHYAVCDLRLLADIVFQFSKAVDIILSDNKMTAVDAPFAKDGVLEQDLTRLWLQFPLAKALLTWIALQETGSDRSALLLLVTVTGQFRCLIKGEQALERVNFYNWGVLAASNAIRPSAAQKSGKILYTQGSEMDLTNRFASSIEKLKMAR